MTSHSLTTPWFVDVSMETQFDTCNSSVLLSPVKQGPGGLPFVFFFLEKNYRIRAMTKNKWPKSDEKTGFGGTLGEGLAP